MANRAYDELKVSDGTGEAVVANITADRAPTATTLQVDSVDNWPTKFIATAGTKNANNFITPASMTVFLGHLDAGDVIIDEFAPGYSDVGNTSGQIVIIKPVSHWADEIVALAQVSHNNDGTIKPSAFTGGWLDAEEDWEYASATTITVPTDATDKYSEGMLIKLTQSTGGTKYAVIVTLTATVLTVRMLGGATLENEAITDPAYSFGSPFGAVLKPSESLLATVAFCAYSTSSSIQMLTSSEAVIQYGNKEFDLGDNYDTSTYTFTAPVTGLYLFEHYLWRDAVGADEALHSIIAINGTTVRRASIYSDSADTGADESVTCIARVLLEAGDTVTAKGQSSSSGAVLGGNVASSRFSGHLVGRTA